MVLPPNKFNKDEEPSQNVCEDLLNKEVNQRTFSEPLFFWVHVVSMNQWAGFKRSFTSSQESFMRIEVLCWSVCLCQCYCLIWSGVSVTQFPTEMTWVQFSLKMEAACWKKKKQPGVVKLCEMSRCLDACCAWKTRNIFFLSTRSFHVFVEQNKTDLKTCVKGTSCVYTLISQTFSRLCRS